MIRTLCVIGGALMLVALGPGCAGTSATAANKALLEQIKLRDSDLRLGSGSRFTIIAGGDKIRDQVTLEFCGADFPSESARTARLQQSVCCDAFVGFSTMPVVSNENVLYDSAESASQAFNEIRDAVDQCPADRFVTSKVAGVPPLKYQLALIPDDQLGDVTPDHVAIHGTFTDKIDIPRPIVMVWQRRGRAMVGVYGRDLATIKPLLAIVASRLAAISQTEAGE